MADERNTRRAKHEGHDALNEKVVGAAQEHTDKHGTVDIKCHQCDCETERSYTPQSQAPLRSAKGRS